MKTIGTLFMSGIIALCFSFNAFAQSSQQYPNQLELMGQFIGTWKTEFAEDSVIIFEIIPFGDAYEDITYYQANGETYLTIKGFWGYSRKHDCIVHDFITPDGKLWRDFTQFVSEKKSFGERYSDEKLGHAIMSSETHLINPDKFKIIFKYRGSEYTWDNAKVSEYNYIRVKE